MDFIIWIIIGIVLMALEFFLPGAVLGILGYCAFMFGVYGLFGGGDVGLYTVAIVTVLLAAGISWFINRFPDTRVGRLFTLGQRFTSDLGYVSNEVQESLLNKEGVAHSPLRPAGVAKIDGQVVDVVTEGDFIDAGTPIVVFRVVGSRTIVRRKN